MLNCVIFLVIFPSLIMGFIFAEPMSLNSDLRIEHIFSGSFKPSNMVFIDSDDILALDRNEGKVYRITNAIMNSSPVLDVNIATVGYRGMLGIDILKNRDGPDFVFLYYTESAKKDGSDETENGAKETLGNRLYRYELENGKLVNPKLLLDLPVEPGPRHTGGEVAIGPDKNVYITVGDLDGTFKKQYETVAQNYDNVTTIDGRSGILRVSPEGEPVGTGILGNEYPSNIYFAYGIRNSFGLDWDPLTGQLWDTENGPHYGDEINIVEPGFNSGWVKVQGLWIPNFDEMGARFLHPNELVSLDGNGKYSEPEFIWIPPVAPTALQFLASDKYGPSYKNDLFVSDANTGSIYHFELANNRMGLQLNEPLEDRIANNLIELKNITSAVGFGRITDMQIGPDEYLYILSSSDDGVSIDRLIPNSK
jgi:glucose/arabinose dehydrogenase